MSAKKPILAATLFMLGLLAATLMSGCPSQPTTEPVGGPGDLSALPGEEAGPVDDAAPPTEAPSDFAWTDAPQLEDIPAGQIKGMINGAAFAALTVRLEKGTDGPTLQIANIEEDEPGAILSGATAVELSFNATEGEPIEVLKAADSNIEGAHAYYYYPQADGTPMSMNPLWACALEISEWTLEKDPDNGRVIGHVKGKVAVTFDDANLNDNVNEDSRSWVAGTFDTYYYEW